LGRRDGGRETGNDEARNGGEEQRRAEERK